METLPPPEYLEQHTPKQPDHGHSTELALQYTSARAAWKSRPRSPAHSEVAFLPLHFTCNSRAVGGILLSFTPRSDGIQAQAFHTQFEL